MATKWQLDMWEAIGEILGDRPTPRVKTARTGRASNPARNRARAPHASRKHSTCRKP